MEQDDECIQRVYSSEKRRRERGQFERGKDGKESDHFHAFLIQELESDLRYISLDTTQSGK